MSGLFFNNYEEQFQKYQKLTQCFQSINNYCGCCGIEIKLFDDWCSKCKSHVDRISMKAPWNRTYFAINGKDCPFQIKIND